MARFIILFVDQIVLLLFVTSNLSIINDNRNKDILITISHQRNTLTVEKFTKMYLLVCGFACKSLSQI